MAVSSYHVPQESRSGAPVVGPNPLPDLTHVAVALESSSHTNRDDFISYAVLNSLMGGGGSFSAGGPGKGMYTQLYLNVLNQYPWIYHAQALNHAYSDSGIFCIFGSAHPQKVSVCTLDMDVCGGTCLFNANRLETSPKFCVNSSEK